IASLEVGVQRNVCCLCDLEIMREHHVAGNVTVRVTDRMRIARTLGCQGLDTEALHVACTAHVAGIWNHEAGALIKGSERALFMRNTNAVTPIRIPLG